jgi:Ca2+-transporting ATPase
MSASETSWHSIPVEEAIRRGGGDPRTGLDEARVAAARAAAGWNELPRPERDPAWKVLLAQFLNPLVLTLLAAAAVATTAAVIRGDPTESWLARYSDSGAILAIVILNAVIGFVQERKAGRALESLQSMLSFNARVVREGAERVVPARELVPGDVVVLEAGDQVPADVRLVEAADFRTDESPLTGESMPVEKDAAVALDPATALGDRTNMAFMGTLAVRGRARALVTDTAVRTEIGRIGRMINEIVAEQTPLEKRLAGFSRQILVACLVLSALLFGIGLVRGGFGVWHLLLLAVSLAVAAIPEGLPAITTITLALGMQRMARRGALIRRLPAVETLGSATVICTDKTGTLTLNDMQARELATLRRDYRVEGGWRSGEGRLTTGGREVALAEDGPVRELVRAAVVPNHVTVRIGEDGRPRGEGDPTETAIVLLGERLGIRRDDVLADMSLVGENPFDSDRRRMSVVFEERASGICTSFVKGGLEEVLSRCSSVQDDGGERAINDEDRRAATDRAGEMADRALRVLAVARCRPECREAGEAAERDLEFLGLVGLQDPPRPEAIEALRKCREGGVRAVMITGDHAATARAIAREMGMWEEGDLAVTGVELAEMDDAALAERVERVRVFARVTAEQKLRIVRAWKARGGVVAMTGDGVNDAPALREADIGVAMGKGGTDVAREAAKMVLTDNNFASIVAAVEEGRTILSNIRKSVTFLLSSNTGLVVTVLFSAFFPVLLVLTPLQLLWINLVTNGAPALGLGVDGPEPGQMHARPRPVRAGLLDREDVVFILGLGLVMGALGVLMYLLPPAWAPGGTTAKGARTLAFGYLAFAPLIHAFNCRAKRASLLTRGYAANAPLWIAVLASAALQVLAMAVPGMHAVYKVVPLGARDWLVMLGAAVLILPLWEAIKAVLRGRAARVAG